MESREKTVPDSACNLGRSVHNQSKNPRFGAIFYYALGVCGSSHAQKNEVLRWGNRF